MLGKVTLSRVVPVTLGALVLVTVFQEDVIRHYQAHLAGRRAARPAREYRSPSRKEWAGFEEHFDKRKVELGNCGRPYATPVSTNTRASAAPCSKSTQS